MSYSIFNTGSNNTWYYRQYYNKITNFCPTVLSFLLFIPFPWRELVFFTRQVKVQLGKGTLYITVSMSKCRLWREINNFFHPSVPSEDALFPCFDRKWTDLNRRRWTSKCLFSRRHIVYRLKSLFHKWEKYKYFL